MHARRFFFLKSGESSTAWDIGQYVDYGKSPRCRLPSSLRSLTSKERFAFSGSRSLWMAGLFHAEYGGDTLALRFLSDDRRREFCFRYAGLLRVVLPVGVHRFPPTLVVQELVQLKRGILRHAISDLAGDVWVVYSKELELTEQSSANPWSKSLLEFGRQRTETGTGVE